MYLERPTVFIPIAIAALAVVMFLPRYFPKESPTYDFLYAWRPAAEATDALSGTGSANALEGGYLVEQGKTLGPLAGDARVYLHQVGANRSVPLSIEDIGNYRIESGTRAPDGFTFVRLEPGWFSSDRSPRYALVKGVNKLDLHLHIPHGDGYQVLFLGWVR